MTTSLPPARYTYNVAPLEAFFKRMDNHGHGTIDLATVNAALKRDTVMPELKWHELSLDPETLKPKFIKLQEEKGSDMVLNFDQFWRYASEFGTRHAKDPAEQAKDYVRQKGISQLFEVMLAALMFHKPPAPKAFLAEKLVQLKATGKNTFYTDKDLAVLFGTFDLTRKGSITAAQANEGLRMLLGAGTAPDIKSSELAGSGCVTLVEAEFVKFARQALAAVPFN